MSSVLGRVARLEATVVGRCLGGGQMMGREGLGDKQVKISMPEVERAKWVRVQSRVSGDPVRKCWSSYIAPL